MASKVVGSTDVYLHSTLRVCGVIVGGYLFGVHGSTMELLMSKVILFYPM